jgi:hypothetical protein
MPIADFEDYICMLSLLIRVVQGDRPGFGCFASLAMTLAEKAPFNVWLF